jgi:hypothetical protein
MSKSTTNYDEVAADPFFWLHVAEQARASAEILWSSLSERVNLHPAEIRARRLGAARFFMLLMAIALENLCRAVAMVKNPGGWRDLSERGGHGLSSYVNRFKRLSPKERDLVKRLEIFRSWAGGYPLPKNPKIYEQEYLSREMKSSDLATASNLFRLLKEEFEARRL